MIYAGGGVIHSGGEELLFELARKLDAPVAVTLMGKGSYDSKDELYTGMIGLHGAPAANLSVAECDVLLAVGARFDDRVTINTEKFAVNAKIIHIDIDPAEIGKNVAPDIPIVGDASMVMKDMLELLGQQQHTEWRAKVDSYKDLQPEVYKDENRKELAFHRVIEKVSELTDGKAIMTTDVGQHQMTAAQFYGVRQPKCFISSGGLGTMGYGLPAAVGAQLAAPEDLVVCITGDGSFQMTMNELATAKASGLPIKVILSNNGNLGMVRQLQKYYSQKHYFGVDLDGNPDFSKIAEAYDMAYYRVDTNEQIEPALQEAFANDRLTLVECMIDREDMVYPMVLAGNGIDEMVVAGRLPANKAGK